MGTKKPYDAGFKSKVALESLRYKVSLVELSSHYKVPQSTIDDWRKKLEEQARELFIPEGEKNRKLRELEDKVASLYGVIGELTTENNFLKKKLKH
jgi:transposase